MKLRALVQDIAGARIIPNAAGGPAGGLDSGDIEVAHVRDDSRAIAPGDVFVAVRGLRVDGHAYAAKAVELGAAALVVEHELPELRVPQVIVPSTAEALGVLAARAAGRPADRMTLVGITGTNGKTTTTYLTEAVIAAAGGSAGVIGTVSYRYGGITKDAPYTTPTPLVLHQTFAEMTLAGCTHGVLEVSSAALSMDRLTAVQFRVAAFTNLTQDHLDIHGSMEAYRQAKEILFARHLAPDGVAVINIDDPSAQHMIAAAGNHRVLRVSARPDADAEVRVLAADSSVAGIRAQIATPRGTFEVVSAALLGAYNVANIALVVGIGEALGLHHSDIARGIREMRGVPGRVERVANQRGLDILVDYAHTPDALDNVLSALRPLTKRRLICVFGCGGDRDPTKRPKMGAAAAQHADLVVVTSDNPRTEDPRSIIDMILPGVPNPFYVDVDRRTAIQAAVAEAVPGDIVLIAGKGHEDYQILGTTKIHFDDREEAARAAELRWDFSLADILGACGGTVVHAPAGVDPASIRFSRVIIDGRQAAPGDLYVAIRGERFDGHEFCAQAVQAGAAGVVIDKGAAIPQEAGAAIPAIVIEAPASGREALGAVARWHRRRWGQKPLIGITGSAGKTSTKELIAAALHTRGRVHSTRGSFNNETGVPLTLLGLRPFHDFAVIEMGQRVVGDIAYLVDIAEPTVGVVVNAGVAHVGVTGSVEAIAEGKSQIFGRLPAGGVMVYPANDPRLAGHAHRASAPGIRHITFGDTPEGAKPDVLMAEYRPVADAGRIGADLTLAVSGQQHSVRIALPGRHNAVNTACAVAAAMAAGVPVEDAVHGLGNARPAAMRGELAVVAGRRILVDCYNANPASMRAALLTLAELRKECSDASAAVAVLGDMLELGDTAQAAHHDTGLLAADLGIQVIALGEHRAAILSGVAGAAGADVYGQGVENPADAARYALERTQPGDWILIKGSRGMRLERVLDEMRALASAATHPAGEQS